MIALTDHAAAALLRLQSEHALPAPPRLVLTDTGALAVGTSAPAANDEVLSAEGTPVLHVSAGAAAVLTGCTLTVHATAAGLVLAVSSPVVPVPVVAERLELEQQWVVSLHATDADYAQRSADEEAPYTRFTEDEFVAVARLVAATGAEPGTA